MYLEKYRAFPTKFGTEALKKNFLSQTSKWGDARTEKSKKLSRENIKARAPILEEEQAKM